MYDGNTMSGISQWLRMEEKDFSEPAGFYVPGADHWPRRKTPKKMTVYEEWEIQGVIDLRVEDEQ